MAKSKKNLDSPELFINRELSWLEFNYRVLGEAMDDSLPLLERVKFLSIFSSNLDEFFLIRVAGLMQQRNAGVRKKDPSGMTPGQQLKAISKRTHELVEIHTRTVKNVLTRLDEHGLCIAEPDRWNIDQKDFVKNHFYTEIMPVLTPIAIDRLETLPLLADRVLHIALRVGREGDSPELIVIPVPSVFSRFISIPSRDGLTLAMLENVIVENVGLLYPNREILSKAFFRITRDADVEIQSDEAGDLLSTVEEAVVERRRRSAVRLEVSSGSDDHIKSRLLGIVDLDLPDVYEIDTLLDGTALMEVSGRGGFDELKIADWPPQPPCDLIDSEDIFQSVGERDIMLFRPYESFEPVVKFVESAAEDGNVLAIKQTLYRTSGDSPIIAALERAAQNGKQVTVLVELKARFDEQQNANWARRLEDAGCNIIYGLAGLKTHCKALLVIRREGSRIRRYVHLSTGNYNDKTAKIYSDIDLLSSDQALTADVAAMFNLMTGSSEAVGWSKLIIAPTRMRDRFIDMIEREIQASTPDRPGLILAKVNSLQDPDICKALYRASLAGVKVKLNVRGICCLRPGVKGISENIEVYSIVDRFLEHARIFYFANAGNPQVYMGSADWMTRNLDKRLETIFPITSDRLRKRLYNIMQIYDKDNTKSRKLNSEGSYERVDNNKKKVRAQEHFYTEAVETVRLSKRRRRRFRPLKTPSK
jgi:polyphosphate kinase